MHVASFFRTDSSEILTKISALACTQDRFQKGHADSSEILTKICQSSKLPVFKTQTRVGGVVVRSGSVCEVLNSSVPLLILS